MLKSMLVPTNLEELDNNTCSYCQEKLATDEHIVQCPQCGMWHHAACWKENRNHCAVHGCSGRGRIGRRPARPLPIEMVAPIVETEQIINPDPSTVEDQDIAILENSNPVEDMGIDLVSPTDWIQSASEQIELIEINEEDLAQVDLPSRFMSNNELQEQAEEGYVKAGVWRRGLSILGQLIAWVLVVGFVLLMLAAFFGW